MDVDSTIPMGSAVADEMLCFQPYDFEALHELSAILAVVGYQIMSQLGALILWVTLAHMSV